MFSLFSSSSIPTRADPAPRQPQPPRAAPRASPVRREVGLSDLARRYGGDAPTPTHYRDDSRARPRRGSRESSINDLHRRYGNPQSQSASRTGSSYRASSGRYIEVPGFVNDEASFNQFMASKRARDERGPARGYANAPVTVTTRPSRPPTGQLQEALRRARDAGERRAALRDFVGHALSQYEPGKIRSTLVYLENEMPRFAGDIRHTRHEYGLTSQPSSQRSSPRSSTSSNRSSPSRRTRPPTSQSTPPTPASSAAHARPTIRVDEHPDDDLPPYAEHDPDPASTRLLAQRLAAEAEEMLALTGEIAALAVSPPRHANTAHIAMGSTDGLGLVLGEAPPYEARSVQA